MNEGNEIKRMNKMAGRILIVGIVVIAFAPVLFTQPALSKLLDFSETGEIGDTIGGITAPIVNLLGAILVYYAFRAQVQANVLIQSQLDDTKRFNAFQLSVDEFNILNQEFDLIKTSLADLKFSLDDRLPDNLKQEAGVSNGLHYINLFGSFFRGIVDDQVMEDSDKEQKVTSFRIGIVFPLFRIYKTLGLFLKEVIDNDILIERHKRKFYMKIEQQLLQHYFRVCNNLRFYGDDRVKDFDLSIFNSPVFKIEQFLTINETFLAKNLFQANDLDFYKKTR